MTTWSPRPLMDFDVTRRFLRYILAVVATRGAAGRMSDVFALPTLRVTTEQFETIISHCYRAFPNEACGMLSGPMVGTEPTGDVTHAYPCRNADESARTYTVDSRDLLRAMRDSEMR